MRQTAIFILKIQWVISTFMGINKKIVSVEHHEEQYNSDQTSTHHEALDPKGELYYYIVSIIFSNIRFR